MKHIRRIVALLIIMNSGLLYMHYNKLADAREPIESKTRYNQEIEVINRTDALIVRHHFKNLDSDRYEIILPAESRDRACFLETESSCLRVNENVTAISEGEASRQSISYEIPKKKSFGNRKLFKESFATLRNAKPSSTILHVTDESGLSGMWVSGLELVGSKNMDMVDYFMFKGNGHVSDLYWQQNNIPLTYQGDRLSIYGEIVDADGAEQLNELLLTLNVPHMDIIIDPQGKPLETSRLLVTQQSALELVDTVLHKGIRSLYAISMSDKLVAGLVTSITIDKPSGNDRSKAAFELLKTSMTAKQFEVLKNRLAEKQGERLDAGVMDKIIGDIYGLKTSFVQKNAVGSYPFLLEDTRITYLNGEAQEDIQIFIKDEEIFYPVNKILSRTGYSVTSNESSIYIESATEKFRFSLRDPFYVVNEKRHDLREKPYALIGNEYYFEEDALRRLFHLSIQKSEDSIVMKSLREES